MWDRPRPGIKAVSPELQGWLLTTGSPGEPGTFLILLWTWKYSKNVKSLKKKKELGKQKEFLDTNIFKFIDESFIFKKWSLSKNWRSTTASSACV